MPTTGPDLWKYRKPDASPVTAEVVSAHIAATPAGQVPGMLRQWVKAAVPLTLYPSTFVGRDFVGGDCLLTTEGCDVAPGADPVLTVLPPNYHTSNAAFVEDLKAYAVAQGRTEADGAAFARWVMASDMLTMGDVEGVYAAWVQALTCTMTARQAVITCTREHGTQLRLLCRCGQRHTSSPWHGVSVWDDEGCHYFRLDDVPMDQIADVIAHWGYRVTGEWSSIRYGTVVRRVTVEPIGGPEADEDSPEGLADAPA
ncbi:hypothetical protein [Streptomyces melanosporofaciens]|uniref:Uncharacterized protein n=1 Tax=Streptomyces melanosporofaciens TaxID=67327 RepID=A0A1H4IEZ4_STRMJ|nr:hypothetical protein [Streptomyces melanosporofaciens]SEB31832.1 hypothetical protein SAMN04490356_0519 [Streptomyces melanosporofaciens]